jgi:uncharacterized membrane protein
VVKRAPILMLVLSIAILASAAPLASRAAASASEEQQGAQLLDSLRSGKQTCSSLSSSQFELIGEYVMGTMLGSAAAHEAMNAHMTQVMGAAGESRAHEYLGRRFAGCTTGAAPGAYGYMMGMWGSYAGSHSGGGGVGAVGPGMMGGYRSNSSASGGGWSTADTVIVALIGLALAGAGVVLLARARRRRSPDPPDILRSRLAKGEITAEEYDRTLRALGGTP